MRGRTYRLSFREIALQLSVALLILSCSDSLFIDESKDTYHDDIADITYMNGFFYTTNYDLSGNAGSQIDLFKFSLNDSSETVLEDSFDLGMNGQGYFAITNDNSNIYLQSKTSGMLRKISPAGEHIWTKWDSLNAGWHPSGITWVDDQNLLLSLSRNSGQPQQYRARYFDENGDLSFIHEQVINFPFTDSGYHGLYALDYENSFYHFLGVDTSGQDIYLLAGADFSYAGFLTSENTNIDTNVVGITVTGEQIYLGFRDRIIQPISFPRLLN